MVELDPAKQLAALREYLTAAGGVTETTVETAKELAAALIAQGMALGAKAPDVVTSVQDLADDLVTSSRDNREMLSGLVRTEVERVAGRMGYVREDEIAALRAQVQRLQSQVDALAGGRSSSEPAPVAPVAPVSAEVPGGASAQTPVETPAEPPVEPQKPKKKIYLDPQAQRSEAQ